jgi:hypothetical protein
MDIIARMSVVSATFPDQQLRALRHTALSTCHAAKYRHRVGCRADDVDGDGGDDRRHRTDRSPHPPPDNPNSPAAARSMALLCISSRAAAVAGMLLAS